MSKYFTIYEEPTPERKRKGLTLGACISDGIERDATIRSAEDFLETQAAEDGNYGDGELNAIICVYDENTGEEKFEAVCLKWNAEKGTYDHGRFDYLAGIGAIRSC